MKLFEDLQTYERDVYSQSGDDGILLRLFERIGATNRYFVEFGAWDGVQYSNTANLRLHHGWSGLLMEGSDRADGNLVKREMICAENVKALFTRYRVPKSFDLLSIDIDGNDYWVWKAIRGHRARVVVIEYNAMFGLGVSKVMPYDPNHVWDETGYHGASLAALRKLGAELDYSLVYTNAEGANAFFVLRSELPASYVELPLATLSRWIWHVEPPDSDGRPWLTV